LASEDVRRHGLLDFGFCEEDLLLFSVVGLGLDGLDLDDLTTGDHTDVLQSHFDDIVRQNHAHERSMEAANATGNVLGRPCLDKASHSCTRVHAVSDCARKSRVL